MNAAIVSSVSFGKIFGRPDRQRPFNRCPGNPMMVKQGFAKFFAGSVEAAASSGGSIVLPDMGVAAFVPAVLTVVPYSVAIVAAVIEHLPIPSACFFRLSSRPVIGTFAPLAK